MFEKIIKEIKENKRVKWLSIGVSLTTITTISATLGPTVAFTLQSNKNTIEQENLIDKDFEEWNKNQQIILNLDFKDTRIDYKKVSND